MIENQQCCATYSLGRELHLPAAERAGEDLVVVVHEVHGRRQPARVGLGEVERISGKRSNTPAAMSWAMQYTGECAPARCVSADAYGWPAVPAPGLGIGARISPNPKCGEMRDAELDALLPELVVFRLREAGAVREHVERDALEPGVVRELHLGDRVVDVADRRDRVADEPVGRDRAVVVREPRVVGPQHRPVDLAVGDALEEAGREHGREEHLGVDAVLVLLPEPLLGRARAVVRRAVGPVVRAGVEADRAAPGDVLAVLEQRLALDEPALAALGQLDEAGRAVAPTSRGRSLHPGIGRRLDVPVGGDRPVVARHLAASFFLRLPGARRLAERRAVATRTVPSGHAGR